MLFASDTAPGHGGKTVAGRCMLAMVNDDGEETSEDEKKGETKTV